MGKSHSTEPSATRDSSEIESLRRAIGLGAVVFVGAVVVTLVPILLRRRSRNKRAIASTRSM